MRSGDARLMRIASKSEVSWPLSWRLGLMDLLIVSIVKLGPYRCFGGGLFSSWRVGHHSRLGLHELDVEAERLQLADEHVERLRQSGLERRVALHDGLVDLGPSGHI